ncbi:MAG: hypothetical protein J6T15_03670 [Bacilli bacterium]|nr:hypothetical protein [Bacilli bacterium]
MYNSSNFMLDRLTKQKEEIDNLIRNYQNQTPVNNFINTNQAQNTSKDLVEWRVLNENEEVDNLYVANKTFFINDNKAILKGVDGSLIKWDVVKTYPKDKKDEKILELENKIKELEEKINGPTKSNSTNRESNKPYVNDDEYAKPESKRIVKYISNED